MQMINEDDVCETCGQTYSWHFENKPVHPFNHGQVGATDFLKSRRDRDGGKSSQRGPEGAQIVGMSTDPVLRIALISAGVITPVQLAAAEESLRVALLEVRPGGEVQVGETTPVDVGKRPFRSP